MGPVAEALIVGGVLILGWLGKNHLVVWACLALLALMAAGWTPYLERVEGPALKAGLTLLTLSILIPFVRRVKDLAGLWDSLASPVGLFAAVAGAIAACLAGKGVPALQAHPEMAIGLIVGSVLGATLLGGVPTGPLIAAGVTGILIELWGRFLRG